MMSYGYEQAKNPHKNIFNKQKRRIIRLLGLGQSYSVIATSVGVSRTKVQNIAEETGMQSSFSLDTFMRRGARKKPILYAPNSLRDKVAKQENSAFSLFVRQEGAIYMPHPDQCKHILSVRGASQDKDHYCQNHHTEDTSYCTECQKILFTRPYKRKL